MARYQRKHQRRRRRSRFSGLSKLLSAVLILAAIVAGCIVFFRVDQVQVEGNARYTQEEIVQVSGILKGDNLFLLNKYKIIDQILEQLTYVEKVSIRRELPSTICITVTETAVAAAVKDAENETWWCISSDGKILERADDPGGYPQVTGLAPLAPSEGTELQVEESQRLTKEALLSLLAQLEQYDLISGVGTIDLSTPSQVVMNYGGRLVVKLPQTADFAYDVKMFASILEEYVSVYWSDADTGTLDMTYSDGQPHLTKDAA